jgi:hypothetical protein
MGSLCSDLAEADNACAIQKCASGEKPFYVGPLSWIVPLKMGTHYRGQPVAKVLAELWVTTSSEEKQKALLLLSAVKRCVEQSVCPFFSNVFSVGHNCSLENVNTLLQPDDENLLFSSSTSWLLVLQENTAAPNITPLSGWMSSTIALTRKALVLLQVVYAALVLELSALPYRLTLENLAVQLTRSAKYALFSSKEQGGYYNFETELKLRVIRYQSLAPANAEATSALVMGLVRQLFPEAAKTIQTMTLLVLFERTATWLQKQGVVRFTRKPRPGFPVFGVRAAFFVKQNLQPFVINYEPKLSAELSATVKRVDETLDSLSERLSQKKVESLALKRQQKKVQAALQNKASSVTNV